jgi:hypothetical protein
LALFNVTLVLERSIGHLMTVLLLLGGLLVELFEDTLAGTRNRVLVLRQ